ncbi:hypothetical protein ACFLYX_03330 [Chloroflexota bacterium]
MSIATKFKVIGKNILSFIIGAAIGIVVVIKLVLPWALGKALAGQEPGMVLAGVIALPIIFIILYGAIGIIVGGFGMVIVYNIVGFVRVRRKHNE